MGMWVGGSGNVLGVGVLVFVFVRACVPPCACVRARTCARVRARACAEEGCMEEGCLPASIAGSARIGT